MDRASAAPPEPTEIDAGQARAGDVWENWAGFKLWHVLLVVSLLAGVAAVLLDPDVAWRRRATFLVLAALLGLWYWYWMRQGRVWRAPRWAILGYYLGFVAGFAGLVLLHPAGYWLTFALYWQLYAFWRLGWAILGSVAISTVLWGLGSWWSEQPLRPTVEGVSIIVASTAVGGLLAAYIHAIIRQSADRKRLIDELEATRHELAVAERRSGALAERQRLAGEIHDTLAQGFASIVMNLEAAEATLDGRSGPTRGHLDRARRTARESLGEARRVVWALQPEALTGATLPEALGRLTRRWGEETRGTALLSITGERRPLPPEVQVTLLRVAQEATANARKHAAAGRVVVTLSYLDEAVTLDVQDDGRGFSPSAAFDAERRADAGGGGYGLTVMRARVEAAGGTLAVETEPGAGTTVAVELPAPSAASSESSSHEIRSEAETGV